MRTHTRLIRGRDLLDLLACCTGMGAAAWAYRAVAGQPDFSTAPTERALGLLVSAVMCWLTIAFSGSEWDSGMRPWIDRFFTAVGTSLIVLYGLAYVLLLRPPPWPVVAAGSLAGIAIANLLRKPVRFDRRPRRVLLVGCGPIMRELAVSLGERVAGVADDPDRLDKAVSASAPDCIAVGSGRWQSAPAVRQLLELRRRGIAVQPGAELYESLLCRVGFEHLDSLDFLLSSSEGGSRAAIAFQAVYTNLIGLGLLLGFAPLLIATAVVVTLFTGDSPVESVECLGFQRIPFRLLRFRTRYQDGQLSRSGRVLERLHLTNLPQLVNVVRGEMTLLGPPPARRMFAERLSQAIPAYAHRFAVKPGILGWSQVNLRGSEKVPEETLRLEYDLYYVKQESPSLDLDIFLRTIFRVQLASARAIRIARSAVQ